MSHSPAICKDTRVQCTVAHPVGTACPDRIFLSIRRLYVHFCLFNTSLPIHCYWTCASSKLRCPFIATGHDWIISSHCIWKLHAYFTKACKSIFMVFYSLLLDKIRSSVHTVFSFRHFFCFLLSMVVVNLLKKVMVVVIRALHIV